MKSNLQNRRKKSNGATPDVQSQTPARPRKRTPASLPHQETTPEGFLLDNTLRHRSGVGTAGFLRDSTQADLGGVAKYQDFEHDELAVVFCLAITSMEESIRALPVSELDQEATPRLGGQLREHMKWHEALAIARAVLRRRALGAMAGDHPRRTFNLPLPGLAGFMAFTYEHLAIEFAALLYWDRRELVEKVVSKLADQDAAVLIGEALVLAENLCTRMGNQTDLPEEQVHDVGLGEPTETMRHAWAWKIEGCHTRRRR